MQKSTNNSHLPLAPGAFRNEMLVVHNKCIFLLDLAFVSQILALRIALVLNDTNTSSSVIGQFMCKIDFSKNILGNIFKHT